MSATEKFVDKIVAAVVYAFTKKHIDDIRLVEDVQTLMDAMHNHYLDCYRKYDATLSNPECLTIVPHPVLAQIASDSIFGSVNRDKLNGLSRYEASNVEINEYLQSVVDYMNWSISPTSSLSPAIMNGGRVVLLQDLQSVLDEQTIVHTGNSRRIFVLNGMDAILFDDGLDPPERIDLNSNARRPILKSEIGLGLSKQNDQGSDIVSATRSRFHPAQIEMCKSLIESTVRSQSKDFQNVCAKYEIARRSFL